MSWKKVQLQERFTLVTQDSTGHLKTPCMSILLLAVAFESEWKSSMNSALTTTLLAVCGKNDMRNIGLGRDIKAICTQIIKNHFVHV